MHTTSRTAVAAGIVALFVVVHTASAQSGTELAKKRFCLSCHNVDKKVVGPAFKDVAKKYRGMPEAEAKLQAKIRQGSKGAWGSAAMPPQTALSDADVKALAAWVLSVPHEAAAQTAASAQH